MKANIRSRVIPRVSIASLCAAAIAWFGAVHVTANEISGTTTIYQLNAAD